MLLIRLLCPNGNTLAVTVSDCASFSFAIVASSCTLSMVRLFNIIPFISVKHATFHVRKRRTPAMLSVYPQTANNANPKKGIIC